MQANRSVRLHASDNLAVAIDAIRAGDTVQGVVATDRVPRGHKMAIAAIAKGQPVMKFGQVIGFAAGDIPPGTWLHEHNVVLHDFARDYGYAEEARPTDMLAAAARANSEAGTRLGSSACRLGPSNALAAPNTATTA